MMQILWTVVFVRMHTNLISKWHPSHLILTHCCRISAHYSALALTLFVLDLKIFYYNHILKSKKLVTLIAKLRA